MSINDYEQAINTQETSESYTKRSWAYFYIKDYDQAEKDIQKALKLNPRSIEAYCCSASIKIALNEYHDALEDLSCAYDLTSPVDFRRKSIEEVINGTKMSLKIAQTSPQQTQTNIQSPIPQPMPTQFIDNKIETVDAEISETVGSGSGSGTQTPQSPDLPFDDADFMNLQKDITQQMCDIGGDEFQAKLMKLNDIPAVQAFQRKALRGEKPNYNDYMELMKDEKFKKYNAVMTDIAKNPKFESVTAKFAAMDWMGAYKELQKDPEALALYMKAFETLD